MQSMPDSGHATAQDLSTMDVVELISRSLPKRGEWFIGGLDEPRTFSKLIKTGVVAILTIAQLARRH
jgi:hypothetical protein